MTDISIAASSFGSFPQRPQTLERQPVQQPPENQQANLAAASPREVNQASQSSNSEPAFSAQFSPQAVDRASEAARAELNNTRQTPVDRAEQVSQGDSTDRLAREAPVRPDANDARETPRPDIQSPNNDIQNIQPVTSPVETANANPAPAPTAPEPINPPETAPASAPARSTPESSANADDRELQAQAEVISELQQELQSRFDETRAGGPPEPNLDELV